MPETSGVRFCKEVKSDPDFTAVTGYAGDPYGCMEFISSRSNVPPPDGYMSKPMDHEQFTSTVQGLLV